MAEFELIMPKMGESIMEATVLKWLKNEGDKIDNDEAVLEIATDKVDSEVPSPVEGTLSKILFQEGDVVEVGKAIAIISTDAAVAGASSNGTSAPAQAPVVETKKEEVPFVPEPSAPVLANAPIEGRFYSPLVLNIARKEGISMTVLETLPGTGKEGRVTKKDILDYVKNGGQASKSAASPAPAQATQAPVASAPTPKASSPTVPAISEYKAGENEEIIEMDRMRKLIAKHMVDSKRISPHVTSFVEADVTNLAFWRNNAKVEFKKQEGQNITFTPLFIEAVIHALKEFPLVNASIVGDNIIRKKNINIGIATALPSGNLIVPVIKNADMMNLRGLAKAANDLIARARIGKLKPEEVEGGTYTISNVGTFGNLMGTPIINQPQVGILATGVVKKKPVVIETPQGDMIGIRQMMYLSHSYDHRLVDGAMGGAFVRMVADYLENWDINRVL